MAPGAAAFVAAFRARFGDDAPVTAGAEAAYFQLRLVANAIERIGSGKPEHVRATLGRLDFDAPQGRISVDTTTNHTFLWPRVAKLDHFGRFRVIWDPGVRVRPDPYCVDQQLDSWSKPAIPQPAPRLPQHPRRHGSAGPRPGPLPPQS